MLVIPEGFAQCAIEIRQDVMPRPCFITFGVGNVTTSAETVAGVISSWVASATGLKTVLDTNCKVYTTRATANIDGEIELGVNETIITGTLTSGLAPPPNVAVLVHKKTGHGGRRGRGRIYLPWSVLNTEIGENGIITASRITSLQTVFTGFLSYMSTNSYPVQLLHDAKKIGGGGSTGTPPTYETVPAPYPVTAMPVSSLVATQRRRLGR